MRVLQFHLPQTLTSLGSGIQGHFPLTPGSMRSGPKAGALLDLVTVLMTHLEGETWFHDLKHGKCMKKPKEAELKS